MANDVETEIFVENYHKFEKEMQSVTSYVLYRGTYFNSQDLYHCSGEMSKVH